MDGIKDIWAGITPMTHQESSLIARLCDAANPRDLSDWQGRDGYYVTECRVSTDDVPGLIDIAGKWTDRDWPGDEDGVDLDDENTVYLPITAWRTLADLKADAAVEPLIDIMRALDDEFDDWAVNELPHVIGKIGASAIEALIYLAKDASEREFVRATAVHGLRCVANYHSDHRDRIVSILTEMMANVTAEAIEFNTAVVVELVELQAVDTAELMERAFADNLVDVGVLGDWEVMRQELGVEGLGLTMPKNPHNCMEQIRLQWGMGIFSDRPMFAHGELDPEAESAYLDRAYEAFSKSPEAKRVIDRDGDLGWSRMLLKYGLNYLGEIVDQMTVESVRNCVLDYVPCKVSTAPATAPSIVFELTMFWNYLDNDYELPEAKSIIEWLTTDGLEPQLKAALSDTSSFGMAKSLVMSGIESSYDMTSEEGIAEFMMAYNKSLNSNQSPQTATPVPANRVHRVGRNETCPCGSGKKYKKCCR